MSDEPAVIFRTRSRCEAEGLGILPSAELLGELRPPEVVATQINFETVASAALFVAELDLAQVQVLAAPHEDAAALLAAIRGDVAATVH